MRSSLTPSSSLSNIQRFLERNVADNDHTYTLGWFLPFIPEVELLLVLVVGAGMLLVVKGTGPVPLVEDVGVIPFVEGEDMLP